MAISEQVEQMEREDLEDFAVSLYEDFEERLDEVESVARDAHETATEANERVDGVEGELNQRTPVTMDGDDIKTLGVGDQDEGNYAPLGRIVSGTRNDMTDVEDRVYALERGEVSVSDVLDKGASDGQLPIQRWRADVKEADHPDETSGYTKNQARATMLWAGFVDHSNPSGGKYKLSRSDATTIFRISDYDLPTDRNTVGRCMEFMARGTGPTDDPENEDHIVTFHPGDQGSQSQLVADQNEWEEFVASLTGVETPDRERDVDLHVNPDADESSAEDAKADDATEHVVEEEAALMDADYVTNDAEDAVSNAHGMEDDSVSAREL